MLLVLGCERRRGGVRMVRGGRGTGRVEEKRRGRDILYDFGSNDFAGAAPGRETVDHHEGVLVGKGGVEVGFTVEDTCQSECLFYMWGKGGD